MSYILDALRRAEVDRERERGQVPGLHAQALPEGRPAPAAGPRRWLPWAGSGLLLLAGIGAGSWWASGPPQSPAPQPQAAPAPPVAPAPVAAAVTAAPAVPAASIAPASPPLTAAPPPRPAASVSPYLPPAPPPIAAATAPAPAPEARIPRLAELPEPTRRELPRLTISGSVYSDDAASRFVIVNGEVMREGASLGGELVLEQIRPRELVLRFKGQRYRQALQGQ